MNISKKLGWLVAIAVVSLLFVAVSAFYIAGSLRESADFANKRSIPVIKSIYEIKASQQALEILFYRYALSDNDATRKKTAEEIGKTKAAMREHFDKIDKGVRSAKGREFLTGYKQAAENYFSLLTTALAQSTIQDKAATLAFAPRLAETREKLAALVDGHIANNQENNVKFAAQADTTANTMTIVLMIVVLLATGVIGTISFVVVRSIKRSLGAIQTTLTRVEGELDFTLHAPIHGKDEITEVSLALNRLQDKLRESLSIVKQGAHQVTGAAADLAASSNQVATSSTEQSDSASAMAANLEEMTVSITHVSERATEAHTLSVESGSLATIGEQMIQKTVSDINAIADAIAHVSSRIDELEVSNAQISNIVSVIREVADQTNLLALNAAIEAARAGEQGRGFAVVADEVRKLAERTAASTVEISKTIASIHEISEDVVKSTQRSVKLTGTGVMRAREASEAIHRIGEGSRRAVGMVEEITMAIREQSQACNAIARRIETVAQMSEENSTVAQSSNASAHRLNDLAKQMDHAVAQYRIALC